MKYLAHTEINIDPYCSVVEFLLTSLQYNIYPRPLELISKTFTKLNKRFPRKFAMFLSHENQYLVSRSARFINWRDHRNSAPGLATSYPPSPLNNVTNFAYTVNVTLTKGVLCVVVISHRATMLKIFYYFLNPF